MATDFERRHPTVIRHALIASAVATYFFDSDDVVWRFIKASPDRRVLEHGVFLIATILIGAGAALCTRADLSDERGRFVGEFLYAFGFASLLPLWGLVFLVAGEGIRILRLMGSMEGDRKPALLEGSEANGRVAGWRRAFRQQAAKWGMFVSMIAFTITLTDRLVEILACASGAVWAILNLPTLWKRGA
jgi:hypothetical protein